MAERKVRLSIDKVKFLEGWKEEKRDHLDEIFQNGSDGIKGS